ncbi:hypothetical protein G6053_10100 [Sphingobacterium sp. DR205]|nr:hypothetical protein G6053_10100 [Sphingobacterium sp. DR205]
MGSALLRYTVQFIKTFNGHRLFVQMDVEHQHFWTRNGFVPVKESGKPDRFRKIV